MDDSYKVGNKPLKNAEVDRVNYSDKVGNKPLKDTEGILDLGNVECESQAPQIQVLQNGARQR